MLIHPPCQQNGMLQPETGHKQTMQAMLRFREKVE